MLSFLIAGIATLGVDVGWRPAENGQTEYIIQLEPHQLQHLKAGDTIDVGVRPSLRNISSFQIVIGEKRLPRQSPERALTVARPVTQNPPAYHTDSITQSVTAYRYPETSGTNRQQIPVNGDGFTARKSPQTETKQGWDAEPPLQWPSQRTSGRERSVLNRGNESQINQAQFNDGKSAPQLDVREQPANRNEHTGQAGNGQRRLIDIGTDAPILPNRDQERSTNNERYPRETQSNERNFQFNRNESSQKSPSSPDPMRKATGESFDVNSRSPRTTNNGLGNNELGPRYGQTEPTLPRQPVDYRNPRYSEVPLSDPNNTQALRDMARNLESRTTVQPQSGPANFGVEPGQNRYAENPRANYVENPRTNWGGGYRSENGATVAAIPRPKNTGPVVLPTPVPTPVANTGLTATAGNASQVATVPVVSPTPTPTMFTPAKPVARPWFPLTLTLLALFASLGGNLYLGWMTLDLRRRFRHFALGLRFHEDSRSSLASSAI